MSDPKPYLRIGQLAKRTAKSARALHLYEEVGLISPAERTESGYRLYDEQNIDRIHYIDRLKQIGLSLSDIGELFEKWSGSNSSGEAMGVVREAYRNYLSTVQEKMSQLRAIEKELVQSLHYLDGCTGCADADLAQEQCGPCVRREICHEDAPNLLLGLVAH